MLYILASIMIVIWLIGFLTSYTLGGMIHILFGLAVVTFLIRLIMGPKVV